MTLIQPVQHPYEQTVTARDRAWFANARFGIFIHLGLYTLHGGNENDCRRGGQSPTGYCQELMPRFGLEDFDADAWAAMFAAAGARYAVLTSRHTEGFCLWDTDTTCYKVTNTPCRSDVVGTFIAACRRHGLHVGLYYAIDAWAYPEIGPPDPQVSYVHFVQAQLTELLTRYGPIDLLWFDGTDERIPLERMREVVALVRDLQPGCVVNNRGVDCSRHRGVLLGDYETPERVIPSRVEEGHAWFECCDAMGRKGWGYHADQSFWSTTELLQRLGRAVSLGGNYLLNVEPDAAGRIRPECVQRLAQMGEWLRVHGDAVWEAESCPLVPRDPTGYDQREIGVCTRRASTLFVHLHDAPKSDEIVLAHARGDVAAARLLGREPVALRTESTKEGLLIRGMPPTLDGQSPWIVRLDFEQPLSIDHQAIAAEARPVVEIESTGPTVLRPADAQVTSPSGVPIHFAKQFPNGNRSIGYMIRLECEIRWLLRASRDGVYEVFIDLGTNDAQADALIRIEVAGHVLRTRSVSHGRFDVPRRAALGRVTLRPGDHEVHLSIEQMPKCCSDIHAIWLIPSPERAS